MDNNSAFNSTEYDNEILRTIPFYEEIYQQITETVKLYKALPVSWLDVGCGTGKMADAAFAANLLDKFVFCDVSEEMIQIAKKRFSFPQSEFLVSDVRDLKYDGEFDVVTAVQVNHYLRGAEKKSAIEKCFSALKSDDIFLNFENFSPVGSICEKLYLNRWKSFQQKQGKSEIECENHIKRYGKNYFPVSVYDNIKLMKECGFREVEIFMISYMQVGILAIK